MERKKCFHFSKTKAPPGQHLLNISFLPVIKPTKTMDVTKNHQELSDASNLIVSIIRVGWWKKLGIGSLHLLQMFAMQSFFYFIWMPFNSQVGQFVVKIRVEMLSWFAI